MNIIKADPNTRALSEAEVRDILAAPHLMRLGFTDDDGWPAVAPIWFLFEDEKIIATIEAGSRKAKRFRADERVYFTIDTSGPEGTFGVRGRARAKVVIDQERCVALVRKSLNKYLGGEDGELAAPLLQEALDGNTAIVEIEPIKYAAWTY